MARGRERAEPAEPEEAIEGASAAALSIALDGARYDPELRAAIADFLGRQRALVDAQVDHLHEQFKHLRLKRVEQRITVALKVLTVAAGAFFFLVVLSLAWEAHDAHGLVLEAFSVPSDLAQRGLTGRVVASKLLDRLSALQNLTDSSRAPQTYANNWNGDIKVEIPETGVSLGELRRLLVEWLGRQTPVDGEVYHTADGVAVAARTGTAPAHLHQGPEADIDRLIDAAAEDVYATTQPYRYSIYLGQRGDAEGDRKSLEVLRRLTLDPSPEERMWAHSGLSAAARNAGDLPTALREAQAALRVEPHFPFGYMNSAFALKAMGHDAAALDYFRKALDATERDHGRFLRVSRIDMFIGRIGAYARDYAGDYAGAAATSLAHSPRSEDRIDAAIFQARGHDVAAAREAVANEPLATGQEVERLRAAAAIARELEDWPAVLAAEQQILNPAPALAGQERLTLEAASTAAVALAKTGAAGEAEATIGTTPLDCYPCVAARGAIAAERRDWAGADRWFAASARLAPDLPLAYLGWGEALAARGDLAGAIGKFRLAHDKAPRFPDAVERWGEALLAKGDARGAAQRFAQAAALAPNWGRLRLKWGEALARAGRRDEARAQLELAQGLELSRADRAELSARKL
jgi:Tfp pilus assembly protein PilF